MNNKDKNFGGLVPKKRKENKEKNISNLWRNVSSQEEEVKLIAVENLVSNENPYPLSNLQELIESIKRFGVEQSLLVQKIDDDKYLIVAGHRRYNAVKYILENENNNSDYNELEELYCKIIDKEEDKTLVKIRLHETNLQARPLNKMSEKEKINVTKEYLELIQEAREKKLLIKGKEIKGKTREVLADILGVSTGTARVLINKSKEGVKIDPPPKSEEELKNKEQVKVIKQFKKLIDNDYMDKVFIKEINSLIKEFNAK